MHDIAINDLTRWNGLLGILVLAVVAILMPWYTWVKDGGGRNDGRWLLSRVVVGR